MITDDEIRRAVSHRAFEAGFAYQVNRHVHDLQVSGDGATIRASVDGSHRSAYRQTIHLIRAKNDRMGVSGSCTCPVGFNCKHVAAVLLEYRKQNPEAKEGHIALPAPQSLPVQIPLITALPHDVDIWLRSLDAAQEEQTEDYPPTVRKRLLYVLERSGFGAGLTMSCQSIELKRDGTPARTATRHTIDQLLRVNQQPKFLRPSDYILLRQLISLNIELSESFIATLRDIIATGRGRWAATDGPALTEGPAVRGQLDWRLFEDGSQRPELGLPDSLIPLRFATPWYVDPATGVMGPVETELPPRLLSAMLGGPAEACPPQNRLRRRRSYRRHCSPICCYFPASCPSIQRSIFRDAIRPRYRQGHIVSRSDTYRGAMGQ